MQTKKKKEKKIHEEEKPAKSQLTVWVSMTNWNKKKAWTQI